MKIKTKRKILASFLGLSLIAQSLTGCGLSQIQIDQLNQGQSTVNADFGDAPDGNMDAQGLNGNFPTRLSSDGARHLNINDSALGFFTMDGDLPVSAEEGASDPVDPDQVQNLDDPDQQRYDMDAFDDGLSGKDIEANGLSTLDFIVSVDDNAPDQDRYVNILIDFNHDGEWSGLDSNGAEEWAVKNMKVRVTPGMSQAFTTAAFFTGLVPHNSWMRMTLSPEPIDPNAFPNGWDGTGEFASGETEDYLLQNIDTINIEDDGNLFVPPFGPPPPPPPPGGGGGKSSANNQCEINKSYNWEICEGKSKTRLLTINGFAPDSISVTSNNKSVATVSLNESNVTINGKSEGSVTVHIVAKQGNCTYYLTVYVKVKPCPKVKKVKIDCCTPAQIRMDPSQCKNCTVVGWSVFTDETPAGGSSTANGGIVETGSHGEKTDISKSTVVKVGNVIKIVTTYYRCSPCPETENNTAVESDGDGDGICDAQDPWPGFYNDPDTEYYFEYMMYIFNLLGEKMNQNNLFYEIRDANTFQSEGYNDAYQEYQEIQ